MVTNTAGLVEKLKGVAMRLGTQGVRYVVEGTVTAVKVMDQLQALMPKPEREEMRVTREPAREEPTLARPIAATPITAHPTDEVPDEVREEARATAELVLAEARAAQERIKEARPARHPLKVSSVEVETEDMPARRRSPARKTGRKTLASASAPRRVTAKEQGFKAKRGQKHKH